MSGILDKSESFLYQHGLLHGDDDGTVGKIGDVHLDTPLRVNDIPSVLVLCEQLLACLLQQFPNLIYVGIIADADVNLCIYIGTASREVLEVLVEERGVGKGDDGTAHLLDLGALVIDGDHLAQVAVTFNPVAHPQAAAHELDAVDEVVDDILEGETDAGTETAGNEAQRPRGDMQGDDEDIGIDEPDKNTDKTVAQGEVDLIGAHHGALVLAEETPVRDSLPEGMDGFVDIAESAEQRYQEEDVIEGNPEFSLREEGLLEDGQIQVVEFKDIQRPLYAGRDGPQHQPRNNDLADQIIEPCCTKQKLLLVGPGYKGNLFAVGRHFLVQASFLI